MLDENKEDSDNCIVLENYFTIAPESDKLWAISLLTNRRPKKIAKIELLKRKALELTELPEWLLEESIAEVGDMTEAITLVLPENTSYNEKSLAYWMASIHRMRNESEDTISEYIQESWSQLNREECFVFNKLITGGFRSVVSTKQLHKALSKVLKKEVSLVAFKFASHWDPRENNFNQVFERLGEETDYLKPFAFKNISPIEDISDLPVLESYIVEWKWEGIRAQIIVSHSNVFIWTDEQELLNVQLPEFEGLKKYPHSFALEGELLVFKESEVMSLSDLNIRISRKTLSKKVAEELPIIFIAQDLLEWEKLDLRSQTLVKRKEKLNELIEIISSQYCSSVLSSDEIVFKNVQELEFKITTEKKAQTIGVLFKQKLGIYDNSADKKDWHYLKYQAHIALVVLMYVQKRLLITDNYSLFSFGVWDENQQLVPIAKMEAVLSDADQSEIEGFIKNNILEKFGPVRAIKQSLVFEISFDGIVKSNRHKSGIELKNPNVITWKKELQATEAIHLYELKRGLP